ncbi:hypothetical protein [Kitasatospora sp. HPMI-4]|uniref:hypothetical protein n=1 Tax=Kitasatospora sp. HPMI-4 TaxID=3448443 RepID=UPI003F1C2757
MALADLAGALTMAGIVLPSLGVDWRAARLSGVALIELGAARPDVVTRLATVIRRGARSEALTSCPDRSCAVQVELSTDLHTGTQEWRCPACRSYGWVLPPEYAAAHPEEAVLQWIGGPRRTN